MPFGGGSLNLLRPAFGDLRPDGVVYGLQAMSFGVSQADKVYQRPGTGGGEEGKKADTSAKDGRFGLLVNPDIGICEVQHRSMSRNRKSTPKYSVCRLRSQACWPRGGLCPPIRVLADGRAWE
jgi:hypothetical protein